MKSSQKYTQHSLRSSSQLPGTRSVAESLLESLSDTLSQTGLGIHDVLSILSTTGIAAEHGCEESNRIFDSIVTHLPQRIG